MYNCFLVLSLAVCVLHNATSITECPRQVHLENGKIVLKRTRQGLEGSYTCDRGFKELGQRKTLCVGGEWNVQPPVCIAPGCDISTVAVKNGWFVNLHEDKDDLLLLRCFTGYRLEGQEYMWCNGTHWNQDLSTCSLETTSHKVTTFQTTSIEKTPPVPSTSVQTSRENEFTADDIVTPVATYIKTTRKSREDFLFTSTDIPDTNSRNNYEMRADKKKTGLIIGLPIAMVSIIGCFIMFAMLRKHIQQQS